jgi:hypothetical protein
MNAEEIRKANEIGQAKAVETESTGAQQVALLSLQVSFLAEIAAQMAEFNEIVRKTEGIRMEMCKPTITIPLPRRSPLVNRWRSPIAPAFRVPTTATIPTTARGSS